jgi:hypothetical protein
MSLRSTGWSASGGTVSTDLKSGDVQVTNLRKKFRLATVEKEILERRGEIERNLDKITDEANQRVHMNQSYDPHCGQVLTEDVEPKGEGHEVA